MGKKTVEAQTKVSSFNFVVHREKWRDDHYHSVARNAKGHMLSHRLWTGRESSETTHDIAVFNIQRRVESKHKLILMGTPIPEKREEITLKKTVGSIHERYRIVCKIKTEYGGHWFVAIESRTPRLSLADREYIRLRVLRDHKPGNKDTRVYSETVVNVEPVVCTDIATQKKVVF